MSAPDIGHKYGFEWANLVSQAVAKKWFTAQLDWHCQNQQRLYCVLDSYSLQNQHEEDDRRLQGDEIRQTPLHHAAMFPPIPGEAFPSVAEILAAGADVNARDDRGFIPLHFAARFNRPDVVSALLSAGADADARTADRGWTPLHFAADEGSAEVARKLLNAGAEVDPVDIFEETPLSRCLSATDGSPETVIRLLREHGADPWHKARKQSIVSRIREVSGGYHFQEIKAAFADLPDETPK